MSLPIGLGKGLLVYPCAYISRGKKNWSEIEAERRQIGSNFHSHYLAGQGRKHEFLVGHIDTKR